MSFRVVVVGSGPGGVLLARELAQSGIEVEIYEKKESFSELGHNWSDAVEKEPLQKAGFELPRIQGNRWEGKNVKTRNGELFEPHAIPRLTIYSPDYRTSLEIDFKTIITDRKKLAQELITGAEKAGARVFYGQEAKKLVFQENGNKKLSSLQVLGVVMEDLKTGKERKIPADIVVESSGFDSVLRTSLPEYTGLSKPFPRDYFALVHREVKPFYHKTEDNFPDHYRYGFHKGYQWTHIHDREKIDVGAGVLYTPGQPDPKQLIEDFIARHPSIGEEKIRGGRSLCIVGPPLTNFVAPGFLITGDAASTSIPTTGCGVGSALMAGLWAAEVIKEAAAEKRTDLEMLWAFNRLFFIENDRGANLTALSALRILFQSLSQSSINFLFQNGLLNAENLEKAINGEFQLPAPARNTRPLFKGFKQPALIIKLLRTIVLADKIYRHYRNYPPGPKGFQLWEKKALRLLQNCKK